MNIECELCKTVFNARAKNQRYCRNCILNRKNELQRMRYSIVKKDKTCSVCGCLFSATEKQVLCDICRKENRQRTMVHKYEDVARPVFCIICGKKYKTEIVKASPMAKVDGIAKYKCNNCKINQSEFMKTLSPIVTDKDLKERIRKINSERMTINNPMKNPSIVAKMIKTKREKYPKNEKKIIRIYKKKIRCNDEDKITIIKVKHKKPKRLR